MIRTILALSIALASMSLVSCSTMTKHEGGDSCCAAPAKKGAACDTCEAPKKKH